MRFTPCTANSVDNTNSNILNTPPSSILTGRGRSSVSSPQTSPETPGGVRVSTKTQQLDSQLSIFDYVWYKTTKEESLRSHHIFSLLKNLESELFVTSKRTQDQYSLSHDPVIKNRILDGVRGLERVTKPEAFEILVESLSDIQILDVPNQRIIGNPPMERGRNVSERLEKAETLDSDISPLNDNRNHNPHMKQRRYLAPLSSVSINWDDNVRTHKRTNSSLLASSISSQSLSIFQVRQSIEELERFHSRLDSQHSLLENEISQLKAKNGMNMAELKILMENNNTMIRRIDGMREELNDVSVELDVYKRSKGFAGVNFERPCNEGGGQILLERDEEDFLGKRYQEIKKRHTSRRKAGWHIRKDESDEIADKDDKLGEVYTSRDHSLGILRSEVSEMYTGSSDVSPVRLPIEGTTEELQLEMSSQDQELIPPIKSPHDISLYSHDDGMPYTGERCQEFADHQPKSNNTPFATYLDSWDRVQHDKTGPLDIETTTVTTEGGNSCNCDPVAQNKLVAGAIPGGPVVKGIESELSGIHRVVMTNDINVFGDLQTTSSLNEEYSEEPLVGCSQPGVDTLGGIGAAKSKNDESEVGHDAGQSLPIGTNSSNESIACPSTNSAGSDTSVQSISVCENIPGSFHNGKSELKKTSEELQQSRFSSQTKEVTTDTGNHKITMGDAHLITLLVLLFAYVVYKIGS